MCCFPRGHIATPLPTRARSRRAPLVATEQRVAGGAAVNAATGGVAVEVVARDDAAKVRRAIGDSLEAQGVPLRELYLREDHSQLQHPYPLRCDLKEVSFSTAPEPVKRQAAEDGMKAREARRRRGALKR